MSSPQDEDGESAEESPTSLEERSILQLNIKLNKAAESNNLSLVQELLLHPNLDVNWTDNPGNWSALQNAAERGHVEVVKALVADPRVDVNKKSMALNTPVLLAAKWGRLYCVEVLLACERDVDLTVRSSGKTAYEWARERGQTTVVDLLDRYFENPTRVAFDLRLKYQMQGISEVAFGLVIFLCDGLLQIDHSSANNPKAQKAIRFFQIASMLHMDAQMVLCQRASRSPRSFIPSSTIRLAFASLKETYSKENTSHS